MFSQINNYIGKQIDLEEVTCLFDDGGLQIYWLGIDNVTAFRCNVYLIKSGKEALIIDPGSREFFEEVKTRALQVASLEEIKGLVLCHQDPDVAASMVDWLDIKDDLTIFVITSYSIHYTKLYDALASKRVYKEAWPIEEVKEFFIEQKGKHFEPKLVDLFFEHFDELNSVRLKYQD